MNRFLRRKYGEIESQECFNSKPNLLQHESTNL